jgi:hypothetical protein
MAMRARNALTVSVINRMDCTNRRGGDQHPRRNVHASAISIPGLINNQCPKASVPRSVYAPSFPGSERSDEAHNHLPQADGETCGHGFRARHVSGDFTNIVRDGRVIPATLATKQRGMVFDIGQRCTVSVTHF